jgi:phage shock protein A
MRNIDLAAIQSRVEELSGRMQKAVSALSASLAEAAKPSPQASTTGPRTDQDVLRDLEAQLTTLRRDEAVLSKSIAAEGAAAEEWERRAMVAVQEGRDDLAKTALRHQGEHATTAETLDAERRVVEAIGDSLDKLVTVLRERVA